MTVMRRLDHGPFLLSRLPSEESMGPILRRTNASVQLLMSSSGHALT